MLLQVRLEKVRFGENSDSTEPTTAVLAAHRVSHASDVVFYSDVQRTICFESHYSTAAVASSNKGILETPSARYIAYVSDTDTGEA